MSAYEPVQIVKVERRIDFWRITDSDGTQWATARSGLVLLCERYQRDGTTVILAGPMGWLYRKLRNVTPYEEHQRIVAERKEQRA